MCPIFDHHDVFMTRSHFDVCCVVLCECLHHILCMEMLSIVSLRVLRAMWVVCLCPTLAAD